jgi:hypothetical protein
MKHIYISFFALCFIVLNSAAQNIDCKEFEQTKQEILDEINEISHVISPRLNPRDRQFLERRLDEIAAKLNNLSQQTYTAYTVYPIAENDFNLLVLTVENQKFESDKIAVIQQAAMTNYFVIAQLTRLLENFSFEDSRIKVIEIVYPAILDREHSHLLYNYLTFSSNKEKLNQIILANSPNR